MPAEIKMTKSDFSSAAADALDSLCKNNKLNTQAVKDGQEKEWQNLTDSIFIPPLNLNSEKNTASQSSKGIYRPRVRQDSSRNGGHVSGLNDSKKKKDPVNNNPVDNGNLEGHCTQEAVESHKSYKQQTKLLPRDPAQCTPSPNWHNGGRFSALETLNEKNDLEKKSDTDLLKMQRALTSDQADV